MSLYRAKSWLLVLVVVVLAMVGAWLLRSTSQNAAPTLQLAQLYPQNKALSPFSLRDHTGAEFNNARLQGKWTLVFFGYTSCPDICPTTLANFKLAQDRLPSELKNRLQWLFVSVDPARDTVEQLALYLPFFKAEFIGITGESAALDQFTRELGVAVQHVVQADGSYLVDHSVRAFLLNEKGERYALFSPEGAQGFDAAKVAADLQALIAR